MISNYAIIAQYCQMTYGLDLQLLYFTPPVKQKKYEWDNTLNEVDFEPLSIMFFGTPGIVQKLPAKHE